jgi:hypothetical protein
LAAVHPKLAGISLGKFFEPFLKLSLALRLRQGIELAVRHHSSGHRRSEVQSLGRFGLRELALAQENTHGLSSLGALRGRRIGGYRTPLLRTILIPG